MQRKITVLLSICALILSTAAPGLAQKKLERVVIGYPSQSYPFTFVQVAIKNGFFKDEGLEPLMVQMRGSISVPSMLSDDTQFSLSFTSVLTGIMKGLPIKFVAVVVDKPLHHVVVRPEITSAANLKGKKLGVSRFGGADHLAAGAVLAAKKMNLKAVKIVALGVSEPVRAEMLKKGLVDAVAVTQPYPSLLEKEGYRVLGGPKDVTYGSPVLGIATTEKLISQKRDLVKKVVRALIRGVRFIHEEPEQTIALMADWLGYQHATAAGSYKTILTSMSPNGLTKDGNIQFAIDALSTIAGKSYSVSASEVRDYTLLKEVHKELGIQ